MTVLQELIPLTDEQILDAKEQAVALTRRALGEAPDRAQFERYAATRTPRAVALLIGLVLGGAALAAFALSIFRVFTAGRNLFLTHIDDPLQAAIAGAATFLLAELLVIGSMLARAVYFTGASRRAMTLTAGIGVSVALAGNLVISSPPLAGPPLWAVLFAWLDALAPPVAVLLIALAFERMIIDRIQTHQQTEAAYQQAANDWNRQQADPENSELFQKKYFPRALKAAIQAANAHGTGSTRRKEIMSGLRPEHWNWLVLRELRAADWFDPDAVTHENGALQTPYAPVLPSANGHSGRPEVAQADPLPVTTVSANGNGHH